jgi:hypothetical protein
VELVWLWTLAFDDFLAAISPRYYPVSYAEMTGVVARNALVSAAPHDGGALFEYVDEVRLVSGREVPRVFVAVT